MMRFDFCVARVVSCGALLFAFNFAWCSRWGTHSGRGNDEEASVLFMEQSGCCTSMSRTAGCEQIQELSMKTRDLQKFQLRHTAEKEKKVPGYANGFSKRNYSG